MIVVISWNHLSVHIISEGGVFSFAKRGHLQTRVFSSLFITNCELGFGSCLALAGRESAVMPLNDSIQAVSSESEQNEEPKAPEDAMSSPARKKRKLEASSKPEQVDKTTEMYLRSLLGRQCPCKKKTCLQQFVAPEHFEPLRSYREYWLDLGKLDQDLFVPWLWPSFWPPFSHT